MNLLIVTGLSGAGKSLAMHALEDIGFFCIDNIPANLLAKLMEFAQQSENTLERVAVVLDIRGGKSSEDILNALGQLKAGRVNYKILFLDARNDVLERRYKETRRRHPISIASQVSTDEAILQEREILAPLYEMADYKIDTSLFSTAQLKDRVVSLFVNRSSDAMALTVTSFGFKYGQPKEADIVFDVRCLPNPFYIPELKNKTGLDKEVVEYIMQFEEAHGLLQRMEDLVGYALPLYVKEGKSQLTIAVGCTGGKHRSIAFAEMLAAFVKKLGYHPVVEHRDVHLRLQFFFDLEATWRRDVFQVDPAERDRNVFDGFDELVGVFRIDFDVEYVDTCINFEQQTFTLHDGFAAEGANIAQAEHGGSVGDDSYQIAFCCIFICILRVFLNFEARFCNARRVGERKIGLCTVRLGGYYFNLTRFALRMVEQGCFFGYFSHGRIVKLVIIWLQM